MTPEQIESIEEALHGPSIVIVNCFVGWECICGGAWPCRIYLRRKARETFEGGFEERSPGEYWSRW